MELCSAPLHKFLGAVIFCLWTSYQIKTNVYGMHRKRLKTGEVVMYWHCR